MRPLQTDPERVQPGDARDRAEGRRIGTQPVQAVTAPR